MKEIPKVDDWARILITQPFKYQKLIDENNYDRLIFVRSADDGNASLMQSIRETLTVSGSKYAGKVETISLGKNETFVDLTKTKVSLDPTRRMFALSHVDVNISSEFTIEALKILITLKNSIVRACFALEEGQPVSRKGNGMIVVGDRHITEPLEWFDLFIDGEENALSIYLKHDILYSAVGDMRLEHSIDTFRALRDKSIRDAVLKINHITLL